MFDFAEKTENMSAIEILNYYRNLYYTESQVTERGIVANAINDMFDLINRQKVEIERLEGSTVVNNIMESQRIKREAKAESYKEFAKLLIDKASKGLIHVSDSPDFVKEMVGEEE